MRRGVATKKVCPGVRGLFNNGTLTIKAISNQNQGQRTHGDGRDAAAGSFQEREMRRANDGLSFSWYESMQQVSAAFSIFLRINK
jgi:hypothetical protein